MKLTLSKLEAIKPFIERQGTVSAVDIIKWFDLKEKKQEYTQQYMLFNQSVLFFH